MKFLTRSEKPKPEDTLIRCKDGSGCFLGRRVQAFDPSSLLCLHEGVSEGVLFIRFQEEVCYLHQFTENPYSPHSSDVEKDKANTLTLNSSFHLVRQSQQDIPIENINILRVGESVVDTTGEFTWPVGPIQELAIFTHLISFGSKTGLTTYKELLKDVEESDIMETFTNVTRNAKVYLRIIRSWGM